jgi:FkbM family methyltransferase
MISYAQNAEDVVLARVLPGETGFYIDVGAADPDIASVTRHFYDRGWSGINIEPRSEAVARLRERRPRDTTLEVAAGEKVGRLPFYRVEHDPDQSTFETENLERLRQQGHGVVTTTVPIRTLDSLLEEFAPPAVDFLKIDVEGAEGQVLAGLDLTRWRPRLILVEAVRPWSSERVDGAWRSLLEDRGYSEALFDGLNLFFVADEIRDEIGPIAPASILDGYTPASVQLLEDELARLRDYIRSLEGELARRNRNSLVSVEPAERGDLSGQAPVLSGGAPGAGPHPERRLRVVVCSSAHQAAERLASQLAGKGGVPYLPVDHPGDLGFGDLPAEFVLQVDRTPSRLLDRLFAQHGIDVVAVAETGHEVPSERHSGAGWAARLGSLTVAEDEIGNNLDGVVLRLLDELEVDLEGSAFAENTCRLRVLNGERQSDRLRLAVVGTPRTGNTWIRRVLADGLALTELPVHDPADLDWEALPERAIVQLHWPRSADIEALLVRHGVRVVSPARHPLDVLLSILVFANRDQSTGSWLKGRGGDEHLLRGATAGSDEFMSYATGPRARALLDVTPDWWDGTDVVRVRYEDLVARDPIEAFRDLVGRLEVPESDALPAAARTNTPRRLSDLSGGVHVWRAKPGAYRELLSPAHMKILTDVHESVFHRLGYPLPEDQQTS